MNVQAVRADADRRRGAAFAVACLLLATPILIAGPQLASDIVWPRAQDSFRTLQLEAFSCNGVPGLFSLCRSSLRDGLTDTIVVNEFHLGAAPVHGADDFGLGEFAWPRRVATSGALQRLPQRIVALSAVVFVLCALVLHRVKRARKVAASPAAPVAPAVTPAMPHGCESFATLQKAA